MHINKEKIPQKHKLKGEDVDIPPLARMRVRENVQESGKMLPRVGDEVVVCGQLFHTSNRVITWLDRGGFNAYSCLPTHAASTSEAPLSMRYGCRKVNSGKKQKLCYPGQRLLLEGGAEATPTMKEVRSEEWELGMLQEAVHQLVVHYDGCGTARRCFKVLHDERQLSCHFIIDLDGTIYQTLDVKERAWHATTANDRSVGVEMCNIGALGAEHDHSVFRDWYVREACARRPPSSSPDAQQQQQPQPHQPPQPPRRQLQRRRALAAAEEVRVVPPPDGNGPPVPTSPNFIGRYHYGLLFFGVETVCMTVRELGSSKPASTERTCLLLESMIHHPTRRLC